MKRNKLRTTWYNMKNRCYRKENKDYRWYGAKGVTVCAEWLSSFDSFENWALKNGYRENLTIDRIDYDKGYSPENCRWITIQEQQRNKSSNRTITYHNETKCLSEWAEELNLNPFCLISRIDRGMPLEKAFYPEKYYDRKLKVFVTYNGETKCLSEWARVYKIDRHTLSKKVNAGMLAKDIFENLQLR